MDGNPFTRMFVVFAVTLFFSQGLALAQDQSRRAVPSDAHPLGLSLASATNLALGQDTGRAVAPRMADSGFLRYGINGHRDRYGSAAQAGEDPIAERQSVDTFTSLEDGQPDAPGGVELEINLGWETNSDEPDPVTIETELEYTLDGNDFLRNTQLNLSLPLELGNGGIDGNADLTFGWQQRWVSEGGGWPTVSTLAELRVPSGDSSSSLDGTLTGIVAKDIASGTAYCNAFVKTANGNDIEDLRHFQWGLRAGYKWRIDEAFSLVGAYVHTSSEVRGSNNNNTLELSSEYQVNENLTLGPGIVIGLDHNDEVPNFGAGIQIHYSF